MSDVDPRGDNGDIAVESLRNQKSTPSMWSILPKYLDFNFTAHLPQNGWVAKNCIASNKKLEDLNNSVQEKKTLKQSCPNPDPNILVFLMFLKYYSEAMSMMQRRINAATTQQTHQEWRAPRLWSDQWPGENTSDSWKDQFEQTVLQ